jgi:ubiquinone/menaquinone biosynthesis C-methylase UbiE
MSAMARASGPDPRLFDLWSRIYDAPLVQRVTYRPAQNAVLAALRRETPRRLLDVGCGTGQLASRLRRELRSTRVVGCDFSRGMLGRAAAREPGACWAQGDAARLPFADASHEALVSTEAFHWFPDKLAALAEFFRVLAPDGRLLVSLVNPPLEVMSRAAHRASQLIGEPFLWPTRETMRRWVEEAGFRVTSQRTILRLPLALALPPVLTEAVRPA